MKANWRRCNSAIHWLQMTRLRGRLASLLATPVGTRMSSVKLTFFSEQFLCLSFCQLNSLSYPGPYQIQIGYRTSETSDEMANVHRNAAHQGSAMNHLQVQPCNYLREQLNVVYRMNSLFTAVTTWGLDDVGLDIGQQLSEVHTQPDFWMPPTRMFGTPLSIGVSEWQLSVA